MDTLLLILVTFGGYVIAYHTYGRFLANKVFQLRADAPVPSREKEDGFDYVPTRKGIIFGHHFTSIAGAGPIVGPAIGIVWGWVPAVIWVFVGSIAMGAVHDLGALIVSLRNEGRSIADIVGEYINPRVRVIFFLVVFLALWIVVAIFGWVIAVLFEMYPSSVFPIWMEIPIAVALGYFVYRRSGNVKLGTFVAVVAMYATVFLSHHVEWLQFTIPKGLILPPAGIWIIILLVYAFIASAVPVTTLLQPRDYINAWQLFIIMGLLICGAVASAISGTMEIVAPAYSPTAPTKMLGPMFPFLFVTIACGAISGFHSLVSSGTSAKQLSNERDALAVGYGSMVVEGALAILVIIAVAAGLGMGYKTEGGGMLTGAAAWTEHYQNIGTATKLSSKVSAVVIGSANMMSTLGIPVELGLVLMGVFIASFAGTTLDTATRIQRYAIAEIAFLARVPALGNRWIASSIAVIAGGVLAFSTGADGVGATVLWPMFGAVNQLLAALALLLVSLYLRKRGGLKYLFTLVPCVIMLVITITAMFINEGRFLSQARQAASSGQAFPFGKWLLVAINGAALILALWMVVEGFIVLSRGRSAEV